MANINTHNTKVSTNPASNPINTGIGIGKKILNGHTGQGAPRAKTSGLTDLNVPVTLNADDKKTGMDDYNMLLGSVERTAVNTAQVPEQNEQVTKAISTEQPAQSTSYLVYFVGALVVLLAAFAATNFFYNQK